MKKIVPLKLVISLNTDGTFKDSVLIYQIDTDGSIDRRKFYSMGVKAGIITSEIEKVIADTITHTGQGEAIDVSEITVVKRIADNIINAGKLP